MKKTFTILNIILALATVAVMLIYRHFGGVLLKGAASFCFVAMGIANLIFAILNKSKYIKYAIVLLVGLAVACVADVVLNLNFMIGAVVFAVGHVFYFVAYTMLYNFKWSDLIAAAVIFVPSCLVILLVPIFDFGGILMQIVCIVYALIISCMLGKAISNLIRERSFTNALIVLGSALFFFSDLMLLFDVFAATEAAIFGILCMVTYWPGQALLAYTIFAKVEHEKVEVK